MKKLFSLIFGIFITAFAYGDCGGGGFYVFPSGQTVKQNTIFVLDGYAQSQEVILELNKKYTIYLKSGDKKIKLLVSEICIGQFYMTQALLKPETELEAGLEYTVCIDNLPENQNLQRYNTETRKYEIVKYKVLAEKDTSQPQIGETIKEIKKTLVHFGCGPSIHVIFEHTAKDNSELIVKTTVKNLKTGNETTYYIPSDGNKLSLGHGMCSGAFTFDDSDNYEAEFLFMDASGNETKWTGERIKFTKPNEENSYEEE